VPPEFRDGRPPDLLWKGVEFTHSDHLKFRLAERPQQSDCTLSTIGTDEYNDIRKQWLRRTRFPGDYSVFSTVRAFGDGTPAVVKSMLLDFNRTEVAYPKDLGDDLDVEELARIEGSFTEDIWLQNVAVRALAPVAGSEGLGVKFQNVLLADIDSLLIDEFKGERERNLLARYILPAGNLHRLAQSVARMAETDSLEEEHYKKARGVIVDNLTDFMNTKQFKNIRHRLENRHRDIRYSSVETVLAGGQMLTSSEILEGLNTEGLFRDLLDLEEMLGWMMKNGFIIRDGQGRYRWVGRVG
jgi:hypothetical protein